MKKFYYYVAVALSLIIIAASSMYAVNKSESPRQSTEEAVIAAQPMSGTMSIQAHPKFGDSASNLLRVPAVRPQAPARIAGMKGNLYGVVPFYADIENHMFQGFLGSVDIDHGTVTPLYYGPQYLWQLAMTIEYGFSMTGAIRDGWLYIPFISENMVQPGVFDLRWTRTNLATGECEDAYRFDFATQSEAFVYAMAYNSTEDCFYGISLNTTTFYSGSLVRVDAKTGELTSVGVINSPNGQFISGLTYNQPEDKLIGFRRNRDGIGEVISLSMTDASITVEGETDEYCVPLYVEQLGALTQPITFSPRDNAYVAIVREQQSGMLQAYSIDAETFEPVYLSTFDQYYESLPILVCADEQGYASAPAAPYINSIEFEGLAQQGTASITMPTETYGGSNINRNMTLVVKVDDAVVETRTDCAAGSQQTINLDLENGIHTLTAYAFLKESEPGMESKLVFCVGHDNPKAPTNVKVDGAHLTWDAPGAKGAHEGYVDTSALTYDVYANGTKLNTEPIVGTSYDMPLPSAQTRYVVSVVAVANGMQSEPGESDPFTYGDPLSLPVSLQPDQAEADLFVVEDGNDDGHTWWYDAENKEWRFTLDMWGLGGDIQNKEWIFLPMTKFDDNEVMYDFEYRVLDQNSMADGGVIKTYIGTSNSPEAMTTLIQTETDLQTTDPETYAWMRTVRSTTFSLPQGAGVYYIGLCYESNEKVAGLHLDQFKIAKSTRSSAAPGLAEDIEIVPGAKGALEATLTWKMPTTTTIGNPLDADKDITMTVKTAVDSKQVSGKPGATLSATVNCKQGNNTFTLTAANDEGTGFDATKDAFIGKDRPKAITNVWSETAEDNCSMTLHWEAPTESMNGGYVDFDNLTYNIVRSTSIYYNNVGSTNETSFTYNPLPGSQEMYTVGLVAVYDDQKSPYGVFVQDMLGPAYKAPIFETFYTTTSEFEYGPWKNATSYEYDGTTWAPSTDLSEYGINARPEEMALVCAGDGSAGYGELICPKVDTRGYDKSFLTLTFYNYSDCADVEILGRRYGAEELTSLGNLDRTGLEDNAWVTSNFELPEGYANCPWIQLFLKVHTRATARSIFAIDEIAIQNPTAYDMRVKSMTGPEQSPIGKDGIFSATIENVGQRRCDATVKFTLYCDGEAMQSVTSRKVTLMPRVAEEVTAQFESDPGYIGHNVKVVAEIISANDLNPNNNTAEVSWVISLNGEPIITDLAGDWDGSHEKVNLTWSKPNLKYDGAEGFESYPEFAYGEKIGPWTNIDGDGKAPFAIQQLVSTWVDYWEPKGWQVINAETLGTLNDPRMCAHSGVQYLIAMSCSYNEDGSEEPTQSADWLISPEVIGGTEVSFWMGTVSPDYAETIEVYYSTTNDNPESFKKIRNFTKSGQDSWEYVTFQLPNTAKYFAFKYTSWGMFGAMIDDVIYTPRNALKWVLEGYNVYRDDELIAEKILGTAFTDDNIGDNNATYHVTTVASLADMSKECPRSNRVYMWSTGVDEISTLTGVYGTKGAIKAIGYEGRTMSVYAADGMHVRNVKLGSADATVPVAPGIYLVKIDNAICKVLVK